MKPVTMDQSHAIIGVLQTNVNWGVLDGELLQRNVVLNAVEAGKQFTAFLLNGTVMIFSMITKLAESFNLATFIGKGWFVWKGPKDGNGLEDEEDRDVREDNLTEVDWNAVLFETTLKEGETSITGEEKLNRSKETGNIRLGGRAFLSLWQDYQKNKENSVLEKLRQTRNILDICFFGLVLRRLLGRRSVLSLYFNGGEWQWGCRWLGCSWRAGAPSASLASV